MNTCPQFLIAAPSSASGKTTIARGLMGLLTRKGLCVQPYKCGPDYIDTKFHTAVCGRPSVNLDSFMASKEHVCQLYAHYADGADVCIVEGMMGLFDGYDRDKGSAAEIAGILRLPVILVVDAKSAAYSIAPLLSGFLHFHKDVYIAGVLFNKVGSAKHFNMLQEVCNDLQVECLGYLPKDAELEQESRYLGLDFSRSGQSLDHLVNCLETYVRWQRLLELTTRPLPVRLSTIPLFQWPFTEWKDCIHRIMVAKNEESFSFIYQEHVDILNRMGEVRFFNPEENIPLPTDIDLLYLPGGYPEKHIKAIANAVEPRRSIKSYAATGGKILAECGGMMYLCQSVVHEEGETPMAGVLPYKVSAKRQDRKLSLGYRQLNFMYERFKGHEFHYSQFVGNTPASDIQVYNAKGEPVGTPVFWTGNVFASYTHLYWGR